MNKLKLAIFGFAILSIAVVSCNNVYQYDESKDPEIITTEQIDTGIVRSISLTPGKYQSFQVVIQKPNGSEVDVTTKTIDFNIDDSIRIEEIKSTGSSPILKFYRIKH